MDSYKYELLEKISTNKIYAGVYWTIRKKHKDNFKLFYCNKFKNDMKPIKELVEIEFEFLFANRPLDCSNCSYLCKILEDCLVESGILENDTIRFVSKISLISAKNTIKKDEVKIKFKKRLDTLKQR